MKNFLRVLVLFSVFLISSEASASLKKNISNLKSDKVKVHNVKKCKVKSKGNWATNLIAEAKKYLGVKYRFGGTTRKGIDCSAFVQKVNKKQGKKLPRTARLQFKKGKRISKKNARKGDLIFFSDSKRSIGHVGIVIDPKKMLMIHASSGAKKVTITSYNKKYYKRHYKGVRRV